MGIDVSTVNRLHLSCGKEEIAQINVPLGHTHTHTPTRARTHAPLAHTPGTAVLQQTGDLWNNRCKPPGPSSIDDTVSCRKSTRLLLELRNDPNLERPGEILKPLTQPPAPPPLPPSLSPFCSSYFCCSHFVSLPFSTLLSFSWGSQMARANPPLLPIPRPIICDRLDDRQIDGQTRRQTERQKEGR